MKKVNAVQAAIANIHDLADIILDREYSTAEYRDLADFLYMNKRSEYGEIFYGSPELISVLGELVDPPKKPARMTGKKTEGFTPDLYVDVAKVIEDLDAEENKKESE